MNVTITGDAAPFLDRDDNGRISLNDVWCDNVATVTNTASINVTGDGADQAIAIHLDNKGFKPGYNAEPGTSDEIEFAVNLGAGTGDVVIIVGTDGINKIDFGQNNTMFGIVGRANLNAGESTGIDADVAMINVETVTVLGYGGSDVIRARGKAGSGPDPFGIALYVYGGPGNDIIKGGDAPDYLYGDEGQDKVWGFGNGDVIRLDEGTGGDVGYGGAGTDHAVFDPGDTWSTN